MSTLALPGASLAVLAIAACFFGINRIQSGFHRLEAEENLHARQRALRVLDKHFGTEMQRVRDWSEWDDAATWLAGTNEAFPKSNLSDSTLTILGEDLLIYWDTNRVVKGRLPNPNLQQAHLEGRLAERLGKKNFPWSGIVWSDSVLNVVTIREVLNSSGQPPLRGWLAMSHRIDAKMMKSISEDMQCNVWISQVLQGDSSSTVEFPTEDSAVIGVPLHVEGAKGAKLLLGMGRPLFRLGREASLVFCFHFTAASLTFIALALFLLDRLVLSRLWRLTQGVDRIREEGINAPVVRDPRSDEIGNLSLRIDEMVSAMRRSQAQLEAALDEAQAANRARVNFLASMTHELRTPLNGVIGLTEFVLKTERDPENLEALELSRGAALGLLETINGVLEFARLEKGAIELIPDDVDLESAVVEPVKVLIPVAEKKSIFLEIDIDPRLPRIIRLDHARLRQVVNNLVGNAIKFTEQGGVRFRVLLLEMSSCEVQVSFEVVDTGVGIPPDRLHAIFEPFEQATSQTAIQFGGTGLGLTIASRLVNAMGGEIQVESVLGEGSRFHFTLAFEVVDPKPLVGPLSSKRALGIRLLLGEPKLVAMMERILSQMNLTAEIVAPGNPRRAWGSSHLIILDSKALLEHHELASLPLTANLLVLSNPEDVRDIRLHLMAFRTEIVALPCGPGVIARAVENLAIPKARVVVAVGGVVLKGLVVGMIERAGLVAMEARTSQEAIAPIDSAQCQLVVVDLDDDLWFPLAKRCAGVFPMVGLADDVGANDPETTVAKPIQAQRFFQAIEKALENAPEIAEPKGEEFS